MLRNEMKEFYTTVSPHILTTKSHRCIIDSHTILNQQIVQLKKNKKNTIFILLHNCGMLGLSKINLWLENGKRINIDDDVKMKKRLYFIGYNFK